MTYTVVGYNSMSVLPLLWRNAETSGKKKEWVCTSICKNTDLHTSILTFSILADKLHSFLLREVFLDRGDHWRKSGWRRVADQIISSPCQSRTMTAQGTVGTEYSWMGQGGWKGDSWSPVFWPVMPTRDRNGIFFFFFFFLIEISLAPCHWLISFMDERWTLFCVSLHLNASLTRLKMQIFFFSFCGVNVNSSERSRRLRLWGRKALRLIRNWTHQSVCQIAWNKTDQYNQSILLYMLVRFAAKFHFPRINIPTSTSGRKTHPTPIGSHTYSPPTDFEWLKHKLLEAELFKTFPPNDSIHSPFYCSFSGIAHRTNLAE